MMPALNTEAQRFIEAIRNEPDPMDVAEALLLAAMDIRSSGETIMACRAPHAQAIADARAAVRTITEQLDWMEGRNV